MGKPEALMETSEGPHAVIDSASGMTNLAQISPAENGSEMQDITNLAQASFLGLFDNDKEAAERAAREKMTRMARCTTALEGYMGSKPEAEAVLKNLLKELN